MFKNISFEPNLFDKVEWQPIDDRIVTEIHEKLQILPCAFPHAEYLRENDVKPPRNEPVKSTKMAKKARYLPKIRPQDDSCDIIRKLERSQLKKKGGMKFINQRKRNKKTRNRARRMEKVEAIRTESKEFQTTKELLVSTMDQYITPQGQSLNQNTDIASSSIAARTRRRSRCLSSSETQQVQNVRRSDRVATTK